MAKKMSANDLYWKAQIETQIKEDYAEFLSREGIDRGPNSAHLFALRKRAEGFCEMSERDLILLVAGSLPYMYD